MEEPQNTKSTISAGKDQDKAVAALAYIIFFLPLLISPDSKLGRYHANQGLMLLIFSVVVNAVGTALPIIGWFIILPFGWLLTVVLFVIGLMNALAGKEKPLPLVGNFEIIK